MAEFALTHQLQLCNVNRKMRTFKINVLIQFLATSTCFKTSNVHHQEDHMYMQFCMVCFVWYVLYGMFCMVCFVWYVFHTEITIKLYKISKHEMLNY
jgi:hypothetical protein